MRYPIPFFPNFCLFPGCAISHLSPVTLLFTCSVKQCLPSSQKDKYIRSQREREREVSLTLSLWVDGERVSKGVKAKKKREREKWRKITDVGNVRERWCWRLLASYTVHFICQQIPSKAQNPVMTCFPDRAHGIQLQTHRIQRHTSATFEMFNQRKRLFSLTGYSCFHSLLGYVWWGLMLQNYLVTLKQQSNWFIFLASKYSC